MIILYAKIGTLCAGYVRVYRKRTLPSVGDIFKVYEHLTRNYKPEPGSKPTGVHLTEIRETHGVLLYMLERF